MPKAWLFDLDDTLFEASAGMLTAIHIRMDRFIAERFSISLEEASSIRARYWRQYGSTFIGLWRHHRIDPIEFLTITHDFDPSEYIHSIGSPARDIGALIGQKIVYTNGPRPYAEKVVAALGLGAVINDMITSFDMKLFGDWRPKPSASYMRGFCAYYGWVPSEVCFIDDSLMNLKAVKRLGVRTVWCTGYRFKHKRLTHRLRLPYIDVQVKHIRELRRISL